MIYYKVDKDGNGYISIVSQDSRAINLYNHKGYTSVGLGATRTRGTTRLPVSDGKLSKALHLHRVSHKVSDIKDGYGLFRAYVGFTGPSMAFDYQGLTVTIEPREIRTRVYSNLKKRHTLSNSKYYTAKSLYNEIYKVIKKYEKQKGLS